MTRRVFTRSAVAAGIAGLASAQTPAPRFAYVGCYTTAERKGRGNGIHVYRIDPVTSAWTHTQVVTGLVNPSFLQTGAGGKYLYSAHGDEEYATAYSIDPASGDLKVLNRARTGGKNGAHMAVSPDGRFAIVANYTGGSVAVLPISPEGALRDFSQLLPMTGTPGPHKVEQPGPHPHQIVFDPTGRHVLVPDKGLDAIFIYEFDKQDGLLLQMGSVQTRAGAGPRHLAFHPSQNVVWVLNELGNTVTTYSWHPEQPTLKPLQTIPSLPEDFSGNSTAAEIVVGQGGKYIYASNRGHDSVVTYTVDPRTGLLRSPTWTPAGGKVPRFITVDPSNRYLLVAHEQSDTIQKFRMIGPTLKPEGAPLTNASPVTIAFRS